MCDLGIAPSEAWAMSPAEFWILHDWKAATEERQARGDAMDRKTFDELRQKYPDE